MKRLRLFVLAAVLVLMVAPVLAQEEPGPGEGGIIIEPTFSEITTLNPLLIADGNSEDVADRLFPALIGWDVEANYYAMAPNNYGGIADSWEISEDGRTYTFMLRDDWNWSDGTPLTSADFLYSWDALNSGEIDHNLFEVLDLIESVEAPDPQTLVITFTEADCFALNTANGIPPVPAHVFNELFGTDYGLMNESDWNLNPDVTAYEFQFRNYRPGEQVTLLANQGFADAQLGYVSPEGWIYKSVPDQTVQMEQFLAGQITVVDSVPSDRQAQMRELGDAGEIQYFESPSATIRFISLNTGDPNNPQDGLDEDGNPIEQGHHPILGDVRVRQALYYGMNFDAINEGALFGLGRPAATHMTPQHWAFNPDIEPFLMDLEMARALLTEAGWIDDDGDEGTTEDPTPRIAQGASYAEDGTELAFALTVPAGNTSAEATATLLQDQWRQVGIALEVRAIDFPVLLEDFYSQTGDAFMIFWPIDAVNPDAATRRVLHPSQDVVGNGLNAVSYNNEEMNALLDQGRTLPGCDLDELADIYGQVQQILHDDVPWIWVSTSQVPVVAQANLQNWDPRVATNGLRWNITAWAVAEGQ